MRFSVLKSVVTAMALGATAVLGQATPQQVVTGLGAITQKAVDLQPVAQSITIINAPLIAIGQGPFPQIIDGINNVVSISNTLISEMDGMQPVPSGAPSDEISAAVRLLVQQYQAFLNILIGKAGLLTTVALAGAPTATALRTLEGSLDTILVSLINKVPSRSADISADANSLDNTLQLAISTYDAISFGL